VARAERVSLYPNLLAGVSGVAGLMQADGLHPDAAGVELIAARLAPVVARALRGGR
jgi:acyl-CoA thioesterase-1